MKYLFFVIMLLTSITLLAQSIDTATSKKNTIEEKKELITSATHSIQVQYSFSKPLYKGTGIANNVKVASLTYENLFFDKYGSTFYFVDFFMGQKIYGKNGGVQNSGAPLNFGYAYMELSHNFNAAFFKNKYLKNLNLHIEVDGGVTANYAAIPTTFLAGIGYTHSFKYHVGGKECLAILNPTIMARQVLGETHPNVQFTLVWEVPIGKYAVFRGFFDIWGIQNPISSLYGNKYVFITEPQIWINLSKRWQLGGEVSISQNLYSAKVIVYPNIGIKLNL